MRNALSLKAVGHATSLFFAISFVLCIAVSVIFPAHTMAQSLQQLLPGFQWLTFKGFFLGLIEAYGYGWYGHTRRLHSGLSDAPVNRKPGVHYRLPAYA